MLVAMRKTLMMMAAVASRRLVLRMRVSMIFALDQRHDGDAGLEAREAEGKPGKEQQRDADDGEQAAVLREDRLFPVEEKLGCSKT
jgi:hypothetical protein